MGRSKNPQNTTTFTIQKIQQFHINAGGVVGYLKNLTRAAHDIVELVTMLLL
jgi:hypothetical protein